MVGEGASWLGGGLPYSRSLFSRDSSGVDSSECIDSWERFDRTEAFERCDFGRSSPSSPRRRGDVGFSDMAVHAVHLRLDT